MKTKFQFQDPHNFLWLFDDHLNAIGQNAPKKWTFYHFSSSKFPNRLLPPAPKNVNFSKDLVSRQHGLIWLRVFLFLETPPECPSPRKRYIEASWVDFINSHTSIFWQRVIVALNQIQYILDKKLLF